MKKTIPVYGMYCNGCERVIETALQQVPGVLFAKANFASTEVTVEYDPELTDTKSFDRAIEMAGYGVTKKDWRKYALFAFIASIIIASNLFKPGKLLMDLLQQNEVTYGLIFLVGLITGLHCIGMCAGLMLSVMAQETAASVKSALLYNLGRVLSYTLVGVLLGGLGSIIAFSAQTKIAIMITSAVLMILMGLNMAGITVLKGLMLHVPASWCLKLKSSGPLSLGLVTGLFPCGPLQMMQVFALNTGNAFAGGMVMLVFSLGTILAMLPIGLLSGVLQQSYAKPLIRLNSILIIVLGILLANRGLSRLGIGLF